MYAQSFQVIIFNRCTKNNNNNKDYDPELIISVYAQSFQVRVFPLIYPSKNQSNPRYSNQYGPGQDQINPHFLITH